MLALGPHCMFFLGCQIDRRMDSVPVTKKIIEVQVATNKRDTVKMRSD